MRVRAMFLGLIVAGCVSSAPTLTGRWIGIDRNGVEQVFEFRDDGSVTWMLDAPALRDSFDLTYTIDYTMTPHPFVLRGFDRGPLAGRALYGLVEFPDGNTFRLDVEPARSDSAGERVRPRDLTSEQVVTYVRRD